MRLQIQVADISIFTLKQKSILSIGVRIGITIRIMETIRVIYQNLGIKNLVTNAKASCKKLAFVYGKRKGAS